MEEKKPATAVLKGTLIALLLMIYGLAIYFANQSTNKVLGYVQYIILVGGIIWSGIYYAKQKQGNVTFGNVFAHSFQTTVVITVLVIIYTVIVFLTMPDMINTIMNETRKSLEANPNLSDEQIQKSLELTQKYLIPFSIAGILFSFAILGAIASLIAAATAKKNPQTPFIQQ